MMPDQYDNNTSCDVLFIGEQTSLVMRLIAELVRRDCRPVVLNGPVLIEKLRTECGIEVQSAECPPVHMPGRYRAPVVRKLEWPMQRSRLRSLIRRLKPAVIHLNYIKAEHAMLAELGDACPPIVATVWGTDLHRDALGGDRVQRRRIAEVLQHVELITADSLELLDCARELAPRKIDVQFKLILWGIDADVFNNPAADRSAEQWRRRLDLPADSPVVLAPRRMNPRYNPERVLQSFAKARVARRGFCVFKVFGDNPRIEEHQQEMLTARAQELGLADRIRFAPPCPYDDLPGLYRLADLACMLLAHDGTPTTAFELMAADVPIIMSDIPDYHGMIEHGRHASLVPPTDPVAVAAAIDRIVENPQSVDPQLKLAHEWVRRHATMEASVDKFLAAYRQVGRACSSRSVTTFAE